MFFGTKWFLLSEFIGAEIFIEGLLSVYSGVLADSGLKLELSLV